MSELKPKLVLAKSNRGGRFKLLLLLLFTFGLGVFIGTKMKTVEITDSEAFKGKNAKIGNIRIDVQKKEEITSGDSNLTASILAPNQVKNGKEVDNSTPLSESRIDKIYKYTVQVSAFESMKKAQRVVSELKVKGYDAYLVPTSNSLVETWNLIKVGKFETQEEAQTAANILQEKEMLEAIIEELK